LIFYILDEQNNVVPVRDVLEWGAWFEKASHSRRRCVQETILPNRTRISTVFLGLDQNFLSEDGDIPVLFETMVFPAGSWADMDLDRYPTWSAAHAGHDRMVAKWIERLDHVQDLIDEVEGLDSTPT
jgi:hypothetical protein